MLSAKGTNSSSCRGMQVIVAKEKLLSTNGSSSNSWYHFTIANCHTCQDCAASPASEAEVILGEGYCDFLFQFSLEALI